MNSNLQNITTMRINIDIDKVSKFAFSNVYSIKDSYDVDRWQAQNQDFVKLEKGLNFQLKFVRVLQPGGQN